MTIIEEKIKCVCGCGELINKYDSQGRERRYKLYHFGKWMKDVWKEGRASDNSRIAAIKNCKEYRKKLHLTEKHKKSLSIARRKGIQEGKIKIWNKGLNYKEDKLLYDKVFSQEVRDKISNANKGKKKPEGFSEKISILKKGLKHSDYSKKKISAYQQGIKLEDWKDYVSYEPYDSKFTKEFKKEIKNRDNYICMLCGVHGEKINNRFYIHHINYDKLLSIPQNCISLCNSCHSKTNSNRTHWIKFFQDLLSQRYGYKYENKDIVIGVKNE